MRASSQLNHQNSKYIKEEYDVEKDGCTNRYLQDDVVSSFVHPTSEKDNDFDLMKNHYGQL